MDVVLKFESDQGYSVRRSRHSRNRRLYSLTYWATAHNLLQVLDFVEREIRGGALSFAWTYPYGQHIAFINNTVPNLVATTYVHGLQTGDQVAISNTATHNSIYTVTRVNANTLHLQDTSGGSGEGPGGRLAVHLPYASLQLENDTTPLPEPLHDYGPFIDDDSLTRISFLIREEFA